MRAWSSPTYRGLPPFQHRARRCHCRAGHCSPQASVNTVPALHSVSLSMRPLHILWVPTGSHLPRCSQCLTRSWGPCRYLAVFVEQIVSESNPLHKIASCICDLEIRDLFHKPSSSRSYMAAFQRAQMVQNGGCTCVSFGGDSRGFKKIVSGLNTIPLFLWMSCGLL